MKLIRSGLFVFAVLILASCKDKGKEDVEDNTSTAPAKVAVVFTPKWQEDNFVMQQVYWDAFGNRIRADKFMHYISSLRLIADDGTEFMLKDFHLADFFQTNSFEFEVPPGHYSKLKFDLGVPEEFNKDQDPAQYPNSHPLSVQGSQGMFWTWNTGYIFLKFEGKVDTSGTEGAELLSPVAIHVGDDPMFRRFTTEVMDINVVRGQTKTLNVDIHVDQILATGGSSDIDLATDAVTHTSNNMVLAETFMDNYLNAITVE